MKYKKLTEKQIIISIDRLTRFKPTEEKYLRVFTDIIVSNLIEPKLKKTEILNSDCSKIRDMAVEIFNSSLGETSDDFSINIKLKDYENKTFYNNEKVQTLLDNKLNFKSAIKLLKEDNLPNNLSWLKDLSCEDILKQRKEKNFLFPIEKVIIAEGITEEILLPVFGKICGYNFDENGVKIIAAGGKNQVVKLYYKLREELRLPIFILMDKDAENNEKSIHSKLRVSDKVYLLECGEFEDLLPKKLIVKTVNNEFKNFVKITESDLDTGFSAVRTLEELFKEKCLHEFKKADFAQRIKQQIKDIEDVSPELKFLIYRIKEF